MSIEKTSPETLSELSERYLSKLPWIVHRSLVAPFHNELITKIQVLELKLSEIKEQFTAYENSDFGETDSMLQYANLKEMIEQISDEKSEPMRYCNKCHSDRTTLQCKKCGKETFIPDARWSPSKLPSIDKIRELAREVGYAIGVHGSLERDLDLIAAPWTDSAVGNAELINHIAKGMDARVIDLERKPLGRYAASIQLDGWFKLIDLSVCPRLPSE